MRAAASLVPNTLQQRKPLLPPQLLPLSFLNPRTQGKRIARSLTGTVKKHTVGTLYFHMYRRGPSHFCLQSTLPRTCNIRHLNSPLRRLFYHCQSSSFTITYLALHNVMPLRFLLSAFCAAPMVCTHYSRDQATRLPARKVSQS